MSETKSQSNYCIRCAPNGVVFSLKPNGNHECPAPSERCYPKWFDRDTEMDRLERLMADLERGAEQSPAIPKRARWEIREMVTVLIEAAWPTSKLTPDGRCASCGSTGDAFAPAPLADGVTDKNSTLESVIHGAKCNTTNPCGCAAEEIAALRERVAELERVIEEKTKDAREMRDAILAVVLRARALAPNDPDLAWLDKCAAELEKSKAKVSG